MKKKAFEELLKIADDLDQAGAFEEADEVVQIIQDLAAQEQEKAQSNPINQVVATLLHVADKLDQQGATKEAQMVDNVLQQLPTLPQGFGQQVQQQPAVEPQPVEQVQQMQPEVLTEQPAEVTPFSELPETSEQPVEVQQEAQPQIEQQTEVEQGPLDVEIETVSEPDPEYDTLNLEQFQDMIDSMKYRFSQGRQREQYEQIMERAQKAAEYKRAYEEWLESAHEMFGDTPIRLDV